jgi:thiamine transporter ThiT
MDVMFYLFILPFGIALWAALLAGIYFGLVELIEKTRKRGE